MKGRKRASGHTPTELGRSIEVLRTRLGAIDRPLSYNGLARQLTIRLKRKPPINGATILKWATGRGSPDPMALLELSALASMPVDRFVLGEKGAAERRERLEKERTERNGGGAMYYGHEPPNGDVGGASRRQG